MRRNVFKLVTMLIMLCELPIMSYAITQEELDVIKYDYEHSTKYLVKTIAWGNGGVESIYYFEGNEVPEAWMFFLKNGIMVLKCTFFSKNPHQYSLRYFEYRYHDGGVEISPIDSRISVDTWIENAKENKKRGLGVVSFDLITKSVLFDLSRKYIVFSLFKFNQAKNILF